MFVEIDGSDIEVEVRCSECDQELNINAQFEYGDVLVLEVSTEHMCGE